MGARVRIKRTDRGYNRIVRILKKSRVDITVGIRGAQARKKHVAAASDTAFSALESIDTETGEITESDVTPPTIADVATFNEFGTGVPERSFLRSTFDAGTRKYFKLLKGVAQSTIEGKIAFNKGAALVGEVVVGDVKQAIADGVPPPNAESTIEAKGSSTPLIDSGQLRGSITKRVKRRVARISGVRT